MGLLSIPPSERNRQEYANTVRYRLIGAHWETEEALLEIRAHLLDTALITELEHILALLEQSIKTIGGTLSGKQQT